MNTQENSSVTETQPTTLPHMSTEPSMLEGFMFMLENPTNDIAEENIDMVPETNIDASDISAKGAEANQEDLVVIVEDLKKRIGILEALVLKKDNALEEDLTTAERISEVTQSITKADYSQAIHPPMKQEQPSTRIITQNPAPAPDPEPAAPIQEQPLPTFEAQQISPETHPEQKVHTPADPPSPYTETKMVNPEAVTLENKESIYEQTTHTEESENNPPDLNQQDTLPANPESEEPTTSVPDVKAWQDTIRSQLRNMKKAA